MKGTTTHSFEVLCKPLHTHLHFLSNVTILILTVEQTDFPTTITIIFTRNDR